MSASAATSTASHDDAPPGLNSVSGYPMLFAELIRRGWSDENLAKLAGGNVLRVMRQAEAVAASMKNEPPRCRLADVDARQMSEPSRRCARRSSRSRRCSRIARLLWCTATMRGAFVDPGGDLPRLKAAAAQAGVTIEKILLTHGHIDHCGGAGIFAEELGVPIEGPHEDDRFWIDRLARGRPANTASPAARSSRRAGSTTATR